ncbi:cysteine/Cysteine sulfinic acid decarboxylase [Paraliobacillus ryukyuensis]|uniref:Coenzyme A biosynthesis bifunctional protein CoaBC n=1 Tax=Paraliobacillus ryukyuensis TaxID=200904 RepID=A0A366EK33_9BACI|nr:bifunctional phosphopantothenoylcysteine decarboxylase/phosphopantothenate--cysteine ligase CoaBC [Paraliobacillus ryukyuensis]RBP01849.1 phosphopantothenate-cysteine ligase /phosphopantothenoylcysteine decarboxylase [Paraliobacillus ryukyuensis]
MLRGSRIVLGVSGGIAAYKACALTSKLVQQGAEVKVIMTESAKQFVSPLTFQALSRNPVFTDTFDEKDPSKIAHIDLADWADLFVIAPATANIIGKLANGIADDMLSTTLLATEADVYIAPAMNVHMYGHPAVIKNMQTLDQWSYKFIEPGEGYLACGYVGKGRLEEPESIVKAIANDRNDQQILKGKKLLISAGPTQEKIDPVRFLTNHSSGKMGFALAQVAAECGADVTLVAGPVSLDTPANVNRINVISAEEMYQEMLKHYDDSDIVIKAAAVADYRPAKTYEHKIKKKDNDMQISFERTRDILKELGSKKENQFLVGFAAETNDPIAFGKQKLASKQLDAIVINDINASGAGFKSDTNVVTYIHRSGETNHFKLATKQEIAKQLLKQINKDSKVD